MLAPKAKPRKQNFRKKSAAPPALGQAGFAAHANGRKRFAPVKYNP
jgi:hypothetical protein